MAAPSRSTRSFCADEYATWRASFDAVSSATTFFCAEKENEDKFWQTESNSSEF
jgi:hypothetical protein